MTFGKLKLYMKDILIIIFSILLVIALTVLNIYLLRYLFVELVEYEYSLMSYIGNPNLYII